MKPPAVCKKRYPCLSLWAGPVVSVEGRVHPCCRGFDQRESELKLGDLKTESLW
ncbi:MAG: SPASM domain-containing protein [Nitrososphaeria archaeon]